MAQQVAVPCSRENRRLPIRQTVKEGENKRKKERKKERKILKIGNTLG
jgi:hypothetical protein